MGDVCRGRDHFDGGLRVLASLRWPDAIELFRLYLATLMIPLVVTMIPNYTLMVKTHLLDSYAALILPASFGGSGNGFCCGSSMLHDSSRSLSMEFRFDRRCKPWRIFSDIILPLSRPGLLALAIFTFLGNYASLFWPLIMIKSDYLRTLPIGMLYFDTVYGKQTNLLMAASVMNVVPLDRCCSCARRSSW